MSALYQALLDGKPALLDAPAAGAVPSSTEIAAEDLPAGAAVNFFLAGGVPRFRRASAAAPGRQADGYLTAAATAGQSATAFSGGINTAVSGLPPNTPIFLSDSQPGGYTADYVTGSGKLNQLLGITNASGALVWAPEPAIPLA